MLYTGDWMSTFSAGVVSFLTIEEIAGITPVQNIIHSVSKKVWCRVLYQFWILLKYASGIME